MPKLDILPFYPILIHTQPQPSTLLIALLNPSHLWPCIMPAAAACSHLAAALCSSCHPIVLPSSVKVTQHFCLCCCTPVTLHSFYKGVVQVTVEKEAATSSSRFSRGMARTYLSIAYPELITLINFAIAHNCAPALTGIISRLRTRLRTLIPSVAKYSLRVSIAPKKIIKAQWSSVGTVINYREETRLKRAVGSVQRISLGAFPGQAYVQQIGWKLVQYILIIFNNIQGWVIRTSETSHTV